MSCQRQVADRRLDTSHECTKEMTQAPPKKLPVPHLEVNIPSDSIKILSFKKKYSLLADMWCRHQLLDEVIQPHFSLFDESCSWRERDLESGFNKALTCLHAEQVTQNPFFHWRRKYQRSKGKTAIFEVHRSCYKVNLRPNAAGLYVMQPVGSLIQPSVMYNKAFFHPGSSPIN